MNVVRYSSEHKKPVTNWLSIRNLDTEVINDLPETGYVVVEGKSLIAAGFLRKCEGNYALIDSVVTNPGIAPDLRDKAMDLLTKSLIKHAKSIGIKQLIAFTVDKNTQMRAIDRHGMVATPHTVLVKALPLLYARKAG